MDDNKIPLNEKKSTVTTIGAMLKNRITNKKISPTILEQFAQNMSTVIEDKNKLIEMKDKEEQSKNTNDDLQK